MARLLHLYLTANHFKRWGAANHSFTGEWLLTMGANAWLPGVIFDNTLDKTFYQRTLTTFAIFKKFGFAVAAENVDRTHRSFFIWFSHAAIVTRQHGKSQMVLIREPWLFYRATRPFFSQAQFVRQLLLL